MRAAVVTGYGPPEVVHIEEVETPEPRGRELLVRVHATTVNRTDCEIRRSHPNFIRLFYGFRRPRPRVLGNEFAGEVTAVGPRVTDFRVGDRVFGFNTGLFGTRAQFGAQAEHMLVREDSALATMPAKLAYHQAAACAEGSHYALATVRAARVGAGQEILVNGGTGAIGSAAVQLSTALGARVTATCDTEHMELVRHLGAQRVIDYTKDDFTTNEHRYDLVFDAVGKSSFGRCRRLLKPRGVYASSEGRPFILYLALLLVTPLLRGKRVIFAFPRTTRETMDYIRDLIESGQFSPLVDRRFPLGEIVEAYRYVDTGMKIGSVVIDVRDSG